MCGIAGFTQFTPMSVNPTDLLTRMSDSLHHRGPDVSGPYLTSNVGLCHRRLSILNLSEATSQPMSSHSGRYTMVYNGAIYNFQDLRSELIKQGVELRGSSDTEVLLALYERDGPDCLKSLNGMFALATWDTQQKSLFLARDRFGKKPLYYYRKNDQFIFTSEIKAILCVADIDANIRLDALEDYFTYQYVPDPKSIYRHVHKLAPRHWIAIDARGIREQQYWNVSFASEDSRSEKVIEEELYSLLEDSVRIRLVSDVPLGASLSGGIDSGTIVRQMAAATHGNTTTCSIGFGSTQFDEVNEARRLADHFRTDHHEFTVQGNVEDSLLSIAGWFEKTFSDPTFIPTYFASKFARKRVTVPLSGDGGDENFAGYSKYLTNETENRLRARIPSSVRRGIFPCASNLLGQTGIPLAVRGAALLGSLGVEPVQGFAITNSFFRTSLWNALIINDLKRESTHYDPAALTRDLYHKANTSQHLSKLPYVDLKSYLPGDIPTKVDRMGIGGTEQQITGLDPEIVDSRILCLDGEVGQLGDQLQEQGIQIATLNRQPGFDLALIRAIRGVLLAWQVDILHCHQYTPYSYGVLAALLTETRVIYTEHGHFTLIAIRGNPVF